MTAADSIRGILEAKAVAVVGASADPRKWGYMFLDNILKGGYEGRLCGVNPKGQSILGLPVYPSVMDIPGDIDVLVVCVPAAQAIEAIGQGIRKGAKGAILITSGFREKGRRDLEEEIIARIAGRGFRIIGPNIAGLNYLPNKFGANVTKLFRRQGPIGIVSQSGSVSAIIAEWAEDEGIGITGLINLGNQIDLCEADFIDFFRGDEKTRVIALYLEGPKDGERFKQCLRAKAPGKPIVVMKPGKTADGRRTALSHTASMAGDDSIFSAACRQYGLVRAFDMESFYDYSKAFALMEPPEGDRVLVVSSSGGIATLVVDDLAAAGLELPRLPAEAAESLRRNMDIPGSNFADNPIDMPSFDPGDYLKVMELLEPFDIADIYLFVLADPIPGIESAMGDIVRICEKPVAVVYIGGGETGKKGMTEMLRQGIPVYPTPERAVRSLAQVLWYGEYRRSRSHAEP